MPKTILVINAGSSSLKFELFEAKSLRSIHEGKFEEIGSGKKAHEQALEKAARTLPRTYIVAIGHRVVHGGGKYAKPVLITKKVIADIKRFALLAPLHNPANLACVLACGKLFPGIPQVACFDTAFYSTLPEKAFLYALPRKLFKKFGIRKYGFHGLSHEYVFHQAQKKLGKVKTKRTITCHLGNGCSLTAIKNGKAIDTTMGFTPLEGVPMGTRSGDIDPSIIFYLLKKGWSAQKIEHLLSHESGLKGLSGQTSDVRKLLKARSKFAKLALEIFCYRIAKAIGALAVALGGLDCIVFTGGIGEHAASLRRKIFRMIPSSLRQKIIVLVIQTDEEKHIAQLTKKMYNVQV